MSRKNAKKTPMTTTDETVTTTPTVTPDTAPSVEVDPTIEPTPVKPAYTHDSRIPAIGAKIPRHYKGVDLDVTVLVDGFEWDSRHFTSISALSQAVTGSASQNGFQFFRLGQYAGTEKAPKEPKAPKTTKVEMQAQIDALTARVEALEALLVG